jgi:hypothetical protein
MIVETLTAVRADVLPPRARKPRKAFVDATIVTSIAEISSADAPVVLRPLSEYGKRYDVRFHEGMLWRRPLDDSPRSVGDEHDVVEAIGLFLQETHLDGRSPDSTTRGREHSSADRILSSHLDAVTSTVQAWADRNRLMIDGLQHVRARSPLLTLESIAHSFGPHVSSLDGLMPDVCVPAWFAPGFREESLRGFLAGSNRRLGRSAEAVLRELDIEIVRPDLFEMARRKEAENTQPDDLIEDESLFLTEDSRQHLSLATSEGGWSRREAMIQRLMEAAYDAAARRGADFAEAIEAARSTMRPLAAEDRDVEAVFLPAPADAMREDFDVVFNLQGEEPSRWQGWLGSIKQKNKPTLITTIRPVSMEKGTLAEVASNGLIRYFSDRDGNFFVDTDRTTEDLSLKLHAENLADKAQCLTRRRDMPNSPHADHLGKSLRHQEGCLPLETDRDRIRTLQEFAQHRLVATDRMLLRCPEPTIAVHLENDRSDNRAFVSQSVTYATMPGATPPFLFRLDQLDEALDLATTRGAMDPRFQNLHLTDPASLRFDSALWNLRVAVKRIVDDLDARVLLMDRDAVAAIARLEKHVGAWSSDASLVSSDDDVAMLVADADVLLAAVEHPLMEDIAENDVMTVARTSLDRVKANRLILAEEPVEDFGGFSM